MTINIQYIQMPTSKAMDEYVTKQLNKLSIKYDWVIKTEVHFKNENYPKGKGKICKMELSAPGPRIFATSNESTYENAVKETIRDLVVQLKKRKQTYKTY